MPIDARRVIFGVKMRSITAFYATIATMSADTPGRPGDDSEKDEMDLINAEFESMVSHLSLDQSSPTTYLDELDAIEKADTDREIYAFPAKSQKSFRARVMDSIQAIKSWWNRKNNEGDGAIL